MPACASPPAAAAKVGASGSAIAGSAGASAALVNRTEPDWSRISSRRRPAFPASAASSPFSRSTRAGSAAAVRSLAASPSFTNARTMAASPATAVLIAAVEKCSDTRAVWTVAVTPTTTRNTP